MILILQWVILEYGPAGGRYACLQMARRSPLRSKVTAGKYILTMSVHDNEINEYESDENSTTLRQEVLKMFSSYNHTFFTSWQESSRRAH